VEDEMVWWRRVWSFRLDPFGALNSTLIVLNKTGNFCRPAFCRAGKRIGLVHRFVKAFETLALGRSLTRGTLVQIHEWDRDFLPRAARTKCRAPD
jgi:hypothetical protein